MTRDPWQSTMSISNSSITGDFELDRNILTQLTLAVKEVSSVDHLYRYVPGLFPSLLHRALNLKFQENHCNLSAGLAAALTKGDIGKRAKVSKSLALPHPLDFEWLFTPESSHELASEIAYNGAELICVGAPSIFESALRIAPQVRRVLVDRSEVVKLQQMNLRSQDSAFVLEDFSKFGNTGDVAIVDSPWYPEHTIYFATTAAAMTKTGGRIFVVVPPKFTRPSVDVEVTAIICTLEKFGLELKNILPAKVEYQAPPFEVATLKALGLYGVRHDWRVGDILEFSVNGKSVGRPPEPLRVTDSWQEVHFKSSRIKFRIGRSSGSPALRQLVAGHVLTSVSRRDPIRQRVTVWTSGNRGFECANTFVLRLGFEAWTRGCSVIRTVEGNLGWKLNEEDKAALNNSINLLDQIIIEEENEIEWL